MKKNMVGDLDQLVQEAEENSKAEILSDSQSKDHSVENNKNLNESETELITKPHKLSNDASHAADLADESKKFDRKVYLECNLERV